VSRSAPSTGARSAPERVSDPCEHPALGAGFYIWPAKLGLKVLFHEERKTLDFPPKGIDKFVPQVAQGKWKP
jgi:hypothetical protein